MDMRYNYLWIIRAVFILLVVIVLFGLCSCDVNYGKRPSDYENSIWICDDPYVYMQFIDESNQECYIDSAQGQTEVLIAFDYGNKLFCFKKASSDSINYDEQLLLEGECVFSAQKVIVHITKDRIFNDKYNTLEFIRQ